MLCTGSELEARDLPLCYEHFGACSRGELEGVRSLGNRGQGRQDPCSEHSGKHG